MPFNQMIYLPNCLKNLINRKKNGADWPIRGQPEVATRTAQTPSSSSHSADVQLFCSLKDDLEHHLQTFPVFSKGEECVLPCHIPRGVHTETRRDQDRSCCGFDHMRPGRGKARATVQEHLEEQPERPWHNLSLFHSPAVHHHRSQGQKKRA